MRLIEECSAYLPCFAGIPAGLLTKYHSHVPVLFVLVPTLKLAGDESWTLEGRGRARQCLIHRSLLPILAQPSTSGFHAAPCMFVILAYFDPAPKKVGTGNISSACRNSCELSSLVRQIRIDIPQGY